jgi:hypothetical protein
MNSIHEIHKTRFLSVGWDSQVVPSPQLCITVHFFEVEQVRNPLFPGTQTCFPT